MIDRMPNPSTPPPAKPRSPAVRAALRITCIYLVLGFLWILASDALLASIASTTGDPMGLLTRLQTLKGWIFILITATVLFFLIRSYVASLHETQQRLTAELEQRV